MVKWTDEEEACLFVKVAQNGNLTGAAPSQNVLAAERAANQDTTTKMPTNPCGKVADWSVVRAAMPGPHRKPSAYHSKWSKLVPEIYEQTPDMVFPDGTSDGHKLLVRAAALGHMVGPINITPEHNAPAPPAGSFPGVPHSAAAATATLAVAPAAPAPSGQVASVANMGMNFGGFSLPPANPAIAAPAMALPVAPPAAAAAYPSVVASSGPIDPGPCPVFPMLLCLGGPYIDQVMGDPLWVQQSYRNILEWELRALDYRMAVNVGQNGGENQVVPDEDENEDENDDEEDEEDEEDDDGEGRRKRQRIHISI